MLLENSVVYSWHSQKMLNAEIPCIRIPAKLGGTFHVTGGDLMAEPNILKTLLPVATNLKN